MRCFTLVFLSSASRYDNLTVPYRDIFSLSIFSLSDLKFRPSYESHISKKLIICSYFKFIIALQRYLYEKKIIICYEGMKCFFFSLAIIIGFIIMVESKKLRGVISYCVLK